MVLILYTFLFSAGFVLSVAFGPFGPWIYVTVNLFAAYRLNQVPKHGQKERYDDRLTDERLKAALDRYIEGVKD